MATRSGVRVSRLLAAEKPQHAEIAVPVDEKDEMFALMLADLDSRLDAIERRTDRVLARAA